MHLENLILQLWLCEINLKLLLQSVQGKPASVGPWGGQGGHAWDDGMFTTVRQINIAHGSSIDSIQVEYDKNGSSFWSEKHGGNGGSKFEKVGQRDFLLN